MANVSEEMRAATPISGNVEPCLGMWGAILVAIISGVIFELVPNNLAPLFAPLPFVLCLNREILFVHFRPFFQINIALSHPGQVTVV